MTQWMFGLPALAVGLLLAGGALAAERDPFAWLEPQRDPAAVAWAATQTGAAMATLRSSPAFPAVAQELKDALRADAPLPSVFLLGERFVRFVRTEAAPEGLLQVAPREAGRAPQAWRTVLDVADLNRREGSAYAINGLSLYGFPSRCLPPAYDRCLLPLSPKGSSSLELREFDLATGQFVPGGFRQPANRSSIAWLDADTVAIAHSLDGSRAQPSNFPGVLRLWKRGTPLAAAKPIFELGPTDSLMGFDAFGEGRDRRLVIRAARDYLTIDYKIVDADGVVSDLPIPRKTKYVGDAALLYPHVVVQLAEAATLGGVAYPAEAIVAYDVRSQTPADRRFSAVYVPPKDGFVTEAPVATRSQIAFVRSRNLRDTLIVARPGPGGWSVREVRESPAGVTLSLLPLGEARDDLLIREEGFLAPARISWLGPTGAPVTVAAGKPIIDASAYAVDIRSARSKDGTMVDYYLVCPRVAKPGPVPTLVGGYGAFGANYSPRYFGNEMGRTMVSWLERGGAFAATAIRGGGERGAAWQLGGSGLNKQNSFDDFAGVGEDLIRSGFTTTDRMGAVGRSSGGMLTAVTVTQHPELFGAVYIGVPVTDLAEMSANASGIIRGQKSEFGDWDDPEVFKAIMRYSPYQNIRAGVRYPPVLLVTSTEDNQVGPAHARKFAAKLESVGAKPLLIEDPEGGHGFPDALKQPDSAAAQMVFFIDTLMRR